MQSITVELKSIYGVQAIYPACHASKLFAEIAGTKTITRAAIEKIKKLGYSVTVKQTQPATI
jgi:hypothetical protein